MLKWSADTLESIIGTLARFVSGHQAVDYCELMTNIGVSDRDLKIDPEAVTTTLVCKDCSLVTVFDLQGVYQLMGNDDFFVLCNEIKTQLLGTFRTGHMISIVFEHDPDRAEETFIKNAEPALRTARRIGLNSTDMLLDRARRNAPYCAVEPAYLVVYTSPAVLTKEQITVEQKQKTKIAQQTNAPQVMYGQTPMLFLEGLRVAHEVFCQSLVSNLSQAGTGDNGILMTALPAHDLLHDLRTMIQRSSTHQDWKPTLFGDRFVPVGDADENDASELLAPLIQYQLVSQNMHNPKGSAELVECDGYYHANLSMNQFPRDPQIFEALYQSMDATIPWRIRYDLAPQGLKSKWVNNMLASVAALTDDNRAIRDSLNYVRSLAQNGEDIDTSLSLTFSTWSQSKDEVQRRVSRFEKAIQGWGGCSVARTHGDPFAIWAATMPAMTRANPASCAVPPLYDALCMLPLRRPASIWKNGQVMFRTPEGKPYPVELCSPEQDLWLELISAPPGSGKSVMLNTLNNALIHSAGARRLPLITWIDKGRSAQGLIAFLRDSLPENKKHEVVELTLRNTPDYAVNQFDLQLGCREPDIHHKTYLTSFLTLLCYDIQEGSAPSSTSDLISLLISVVYEQVSKRSPYLYEAGVDLTVDRILDETGLLEEHGQEWFASTPWYEVMDLLFARGHTYAATLAQRQAVPTLSDFSAALQNPSVQQLYGGAKTKTQEDLLQYVQRCLTSAADRYAVFAGRTKFDISSESRVIVIETGEVLASKTPEGMLSNCIYYLFARNLGARNYFISYENLMPVVPALYHDYHAQRLQDIHEEMKTLAWDEFHNTGGIGVLTRLVEDDSREGRKSGVRIAVASQYLSDFPSILLNAATSIYIMRGKNAGDAEVLRETMRISDTAIEQLDLHCRGPESKGGNFLAIYRTKRGQITQLLTNTPGLIELWCYNTNQADMALRAALYKRIDQGIARTLLAKAFPTGTAVPHINSYKRRMGDSEELSPTGSVIEAIVDDLLVKHSDVLTTGEHAA